jgi:hypothetical protein
LSNSLLEEGCQSRGPPFTHRATEESAKSHRDVSALTRSPASKLRGYIPEGAPKLVIVIYSQGCALMQVHQDHGLCAK